MSVVPAFAANANDTYSITINDSVSGFEYTAYQIFKGTVADASSTNKKLASVEWGDDVNSAGLLAALVAETNKEGSPLKDLSITADSTAADVADALGTITSDSDAAKLFADLVNKNLTGAGKKSPKAPTEGKYVINDLDAGYYLVKNTEIAPETTDEQGVKTQYTGTDMILEVVSNAEATPKRSNTPEYDKKVSDEQAAAGSEENTASIGDTVYFHVPITLPDNITAYAAYYLEITDTMEKTFDPVLKSGALDFKVAIDKNANGFIDDGDVDITSNFTCTLTDGPSASTPADTSITIKNNDILKINGITNSTKLVVEYSGVVRTDANVQKVPNTNKVKVVYSNNPDYQGNPEQYNPTGEGPDQQTKTFVATLKLKKIDGVTKNALTGAKFKIEGTPLNTVLVKGTRFEKNDNGTYYLLNDGTYTTTAPTEQGVDQSKYASLTDKYVKLNTAEVMTTKGENPITAEGFVDDSGFLEFKGLNQGTYDITELIAPLGYNKISGAIKVKIDASITNGEVTWSGKVVDSTGEPVTIDGQEVKATLDGDGVLTLEIENNSGQELPSTGGIGTTIFYVLGALLVIGAGVLLVTRRRMNAN